MLPWAHLAFGYLLYSIGGRVVRRGPPADWSTIALVVGTQLPDLIDKPLNWWFGIFDGRGAGHSLLVMMPCCLLLYVVARRHGRGSLAGGLAVGVFAHLISDAWLAILVGAIVAGAPYLFWPLLPTPTYPKDSAADHLDAIISALQGLPWGSPTELLTSWFGLQLLLMLFPLSLWVYDGLPGVRPITDRLRNVGQS